MITKIIFETNSICNLSFFTTVKNYRNFCYFSELVIGNFEHSELFEVSGNFEKRRKKKEKSKPHNHTQHIVSLLIFSDSIQIGKTTWDKV